MILQIHSLSLGPLGFCGWVEQRFPGRALDELHGHADSPLIVLHPERAQEQYSGGLRMQ